MLPTYPVVGWEQVGPRDGWRGGAQNTFSMESRKALPPTGPSLLPCPSGTLPQGHLCVLPSQTSLPSLAHLMFYLLSTSLQPNSIPRPSDSF